MSSIKEEFDNWLSHLQNLSVDESNARLGGFYEWLLSQKETAALIEELTSDGTAQQVLNEAGRKKPPKATTPRLVSGIGVILLKELHSGKRALEIAYEYGITPGYNTNRVQDLLNTILERYISPAIDFIYKNLPDSDVRVNFDEGLYQKQFPLEITESLLKFSADHPDPRRAAFIMMQFGNTQGHKNIVSGIKQALNKYGISALRADDKEYHDDLFPNVQTYMHGCGFGVAVFERLEADDFNPNVSLEVGYMRGIGKRVCLLKDKTLKTLQTDLVGKLYKSFDPQDPIGTIPTELDKWVKDKILLT